MTLVGVTGPNAAGKGEVAQYLRNRGFHYVSLSDVVREELRKQQIPLDRVHMTQTGARLRKEFGAGVLAERIRPRLVERSIIDSIRHPEEVAVLRQAGDLLLIGVVAPVPLRLARTQQRSRSGDAQSLEAFLAEEAAQNSADPAGQQITSCLALADVTIVNTGTIEHLHRQTERVVTAWLNAHSPRLPQKHSSSQP